MTHTKNQRRMRRAGGSRRLGAILSMELVLVLPILIGLLLAIIELGLLWSANHTVQEAASVGCRVASLPGSTPDAVRQAVNRVLRKPDLIQTAQVNIEGGWNTGADVAVTVAVPMNVASPDLLRPLGFSLQNRNLVSQTVMRRE